MNFYENTKNPNFEENTEKYKFFQSKGGNNKINTFLK